VLDLMAVGVLAALRKRGVAVPDDVSVAGFDDIQMVRDVTPPLSTVRIPMADMGARALRLALRPQPAQLAREHVAAEVVLRASTAAVRALRRPARTEGT
jgi:LacI family transcriptional regulator